ncbi:nitroreductase [Acidovorax sp. NO-1]|uniref:nitroreductase family protein n=1 Tax=Acidovorax sp. NO-1 TaxID=512030 RepID=UPI00023FD2FA|nr:nitroreductase family protein [Acidovorax sp. NO-1]EHL21813.1 nitroreductase [Acidovorax sp. NO-1]
MSSHTVASAIETRVSTHLFDASHALDEAQIAELVRLATLAPTAYHLQNWRFIAVRTPAAKARLHALAWRQQKVLDAAVTYIICGTLQAHTPLADRLAPVVRAGVFGQAVGDAWVAQATAAHAPDAQLQRDEAVRSASLAAMTMMLAAEGMGLASAPMGGFDATGVASEFGLQSDELPVMLVAVGRAAVMPVPKPRRPVAEVLALV